VLETFRIALLFRSGFVARTTIRNDDAGRLCPRPKKTSFYGTYFLLKLTGFFIQVLGRGNAQGRNCYVFASMMIAAASVCQAAEGHAVSA